jgi:hypothetical protein
MQSIHLVSLFNPCHRLPLTLYRSHTQLNQRVGSQTKTRDPPAHSSLFYGTPPTTPSPLRFVIPPLIQDGSGSSTRTSEPVARITRAYPVNLHLYGAILRIRLVPRPVHFEPPYRTPEPLLILYRKRLTAFSNQFTRLSSFLEDLVLNLGLVLDLAFYVINKIDTLATHYTSPISFD